MRHLFRHRIPAWVRAAVLPVLLAAVFTSCAPLPERSVCFFGSSVCRGVGADSLHGYAWLTAQTLGDEWQYTNASVDGNDTWDLLARFHRDVVPLNASIVVIGLALGNEGLHEKGEAAVLSYCENLPRLADSIRAYGGIPVLTNSYPRGDYNETDYSDVRRVNLMMQQWDIPTVNLMGCIDDGTGCWPADCWNGSDIYHPDTRGHREMASAFVPSMFEALRRGKPVPVREGTEEHRTGIDSLCFVPEPGVRSYTLSYISDDTVRTYVCSAIRGTCTAYAGEGCTGVTEWDGHTGKIVVRGRNLRQLFFFRGALTPDEVRLLAHGGMLRSGLEIYAPLTGHRRNRTANKALSMNESIVIL